MKKTCLLALCMFMLLAAFPTSTPATAQQIDARELKGDARRPTDVITRPDGLRMLIFHLSDEEVARFRSENRPKTVFSYMAYTSISEPDITGGIDAFDVLPLEFVDYYYALIVANFSSTPHVGTVTMKLAGPVRWTERFNGVSIPGSTIVALWWQADSVEIVGNYLFKATMTTAGAMKSRFCAGC